jgi:hypothetical protein
LLLGLGLGVFLYRRKQAKTFSYLSADNLKPLDKDVFKISENLANEPATQSGKDDSPLTTSEVFGDLADNDLDSIMSTKNKAEGDMVLEQARIYVNINREREAIMLLKSQIQAAPKASLRHWIELLDIYRKTNQKEEFLESARQLHHGFNVMLPTWDKAALPIVVATSLVEFPHIAEHLIKLWANSSRTPEALEEAKIYLDKLLTDNRDSERGGFGLEVVQEILLLRDILEIREKLTNET